RRSRPGNRMSWPTHLQHLTATSEPQQFLDLALYLLLPLPTDHTLCGVEARFFQRIEVIALASAWRCESISNIELNVHYAQTPAQSETGQPIDHPKVLSITTLLAADDN